MSVKRAVSYSVIVAALALAVLAQPHAQTRAAAPVVAIRNATLVTVTRGTIANGTIVLRDGKIAALGTNVQIPAGAEVVDGSGKFVSPGIIDCHSHIAADSINRGRHDRQLDDRDRRRLQPDRYRHLIATSAVASPWRTSCMAAPIRSAARTS
jgi:imidazolonepropionase-like amidohydrolase